MGTEINSLKELQAAYGLDSAAAQSVQYKLFVGKNRLDSLLQEFFDETGHNAVPNEDGVYTLHGAEIVVLKKWDGL